MQPVFDRLLSAGRNGLGNLTFMMWELEVQSAAMYVKYLTQVPGAHGGAFEVPAGTSFAPRAVPEDVAIVCKVNDIDIDAEPDIEILPKLAIEMISSAYLHCAPPRETEAFLYVHCVSGPTGKADKETLTEERYSGFQLMVVLGNVMWDKLGKEARKCFWSWLLLYMHFYMCQGWPVGDALNNYPHLKNVIERLVELLPDKIPPPVGAAVAPGATPTFVFPDRPEELMWYAGNPPALQEVSSKQVATDNLVPVSMASCMEKSASMSIFDTDGLFQHSIQFTHPREGNLCLSHDLQTIQTVNEEGDLEEWVMSNLVRHIPHTKDRCGDGKNQVNYKEVILYYEKKRNGR